MNDLGWLSRSRPNGGALKVSGMVCRACGRELYVLVRGDDSGKAYCRGCDEVSGSCFCPDAREAV